MKKIVATCLLLLSQAAWASCPEFLDQSMRKLHSSDEINFCETFAGKPMLIVNTASFCGYTPQFKGLEALHREFGERGLVVVGFASNDFRQESDDEAEAAHICYKNYGVSFTMISPSHVKGDNANPVFQALNAQSGPPKWNFNKYLVNAEGTVVEHFGSSTQPDSEKLRSAIESLL